MGKSLSRLRMTLSPKKLSQKNVKSPQKPAPHVHSPHDNLNDEGSKALEYKSFHASRFKVCVFSVLHCLLTFASIILDLWILPARLICVCCHNSDCAVCGRGTLGYKEGCWYCTMPARPKGGEYISSLYGFGFDFGPGLIPLNM